MTTILSITPWGNSHGIRLSRELMLEMGISPDTPLEALVLAMRLQAMSLARIHESGASLGA